MRTSRLSLAGTVILALLGGLNAAVVAQDEPEASEPGGSTLLDYTMPYLDVTDGGTTGHSAGRTEIRGLVIEGVDVHLASGDPRLRGRAWAIENNDIYTDSGAVVGVAIAGLDNEDGSWRGTPYGYMTPTGSSDNLVLVTGDGAYEGLSAMMCAGNISWSSARSPSRMAWCE